MMGKMDKIIIGVSLSGQVSQLESTLLEAGIDIPPPLPLEGRGTDGGGAGDVDAAALGGSE